MAPFLLVTKSSLPSGGLRKKKKKSEIARGGSPPIVGGHTLCSIAGASYKPRTPHGTKANTPVLETTTTKRPLTDVI